MTEMEMATGADTGQNNRGASLPNHPAYIAAERLLRSGLSVIPCDPKSKRPTIQRWKEHQTKPITRTKSYQWDGIAAICGQVSGNLECLDFDFEGAWFDDWKAFVEHEQPGLLDKLVIQRTQSKGFHCVYKCAEPVPGNQKLATEMVPVSGSGEYAYMDKRLAAHQVFGNWYLLPAMIETRGEGGYFLCAPSPGYRLLNGDFVDLPVISTQERNVLIRSAMALNRYFPKSPRGSINPESDGDNRPGILFNQKTSMKALLEKRDWKPAGERNGVMHFTRPGKNSGVSASSYNDKILHVFTSNAPPLEEGGSYAPFAIYSLFEHGGDYSAAAKALASHGFGEKLKSDKFTGGPDENESAPPDKQAWDLARQIFPRIPFPWNVFPDSISESLQTLARSCATEDSSLPGTALAMIGAALGRKVNVSPKVGWNEPVIFWALDIRESGEGKTPVMHAMAGVLKRKQKDAHDQYEIVLSDWGAQPKKTRGEPPTPARGYFLTDLTLEGLRTDLEHHPTGGVIVMLNEVSALISGQNQYKAKGTDREAWLSLHDGKAARVVRASKTIFIKESRVQIIGGIQPGIFRKVFGSENGQFLEDGTIFRCLFVYSPPCHHDLTTECWGESQKAVWDRILKKSFSWSDASDPINMILSADAQKIFFQWRNKLDRIKTQLPKEIRGFLPKAYGNALRLAAAIDCMHRFNTDLNPRPLLDVEGIERGIKATMFYLGQAVDAIRLILGDELKEDPIQSKILDALWAGPMTKTEINNNVFQRHLSAQKITDALKELEESGRVIESAEPTEGRHRVLFSLNSQTVANKQSHKPRLNSLISLNSPPEENIFNLSEDEVVI